MVRKFFMATAITVLAVSSTACASKKFVRTSVGEVNTKVDSLGKSVEETQERTRKNEGRIGEVDTKAQAAADSAFTSAAQQASSCRQAGDPTGVAKVVVTFAPSGRVTSATISGPPFAGTETGSCIAKTMRGMSLPAFEGERMTISKTVVIM